MDLFGRKRVQLYVIGWLPLTVETGQSGKTPERKPLFS